MIKVLTVFLILTSFDDINWITVEVDKNVTINLPDNYMKIDTLGQSIYMGGTETSIVSLSVSPRNSADTYASKSDLTQSYNNLIAGFLSSLNAPVTLSKGDFQLDGVDGRKVEFRYD